MSARDELTKRVTIVIHEQWCAYGPGRTLLDAAVAEAIVDDLTSNPAALRALLSAAWMLDAADPVDPLEVPGRVIATGRAAVPAAGKGSPWWLPADVLVRMVDAVSTAVWHKACDLLLGPPLTPAMVEAVRLTEAGDLEVM